MDKIPETAALPIGDDVRLGTCKAKFRKILIGMDFSGPMVPPLNAAVSLAEKFGSTLFLVHAVPPVLYGPGATPDLLDVDLDSARAQVDDIVSQVKMGSIHYRILVEFAEPTDLIDEVARARAVDLIVVGSHGAHGLEKLAFGSVAESVLRRVLCPVLVLGPHCQKNLASIQSIVFATDLEIGAFRPAQYASSIAEEMNARLTLLHVRKPGLKVDEVSPEILENRLAGTLRQLLPADAELWCQPKIRVEAGNASEEVLRVAESESADLIVVGVREKSTLADHSPWSTLSHIIRGANCPVLGVRGHLI
ncbi:MAG: universal stress protein [Acidobacteriaceae bacterium]